MISVAITILLLIAFLFLYIKFGRIDLLSLPKNSLLYNNYYVDSMQCTSQTGAPIGICTEVLYRVSNNISLPNRIVLAKYAFSSNDTANGYLNPILNGTNSTAVKFSGLTMFYTSTPFINGQTVFTSYLVSNRTIWASSSLFNYTQPKVIAEQFTLNLTYKMNEGNNA